MTFQTEVLKQLVSWASISFDKSLNQPSLPHVIIVLNATEPGINDSQWDTETATEALLGNYKDSIHQVPALVEVLTQLQGKGKTIETTKELLEYYYSSVSVIRIPHKSQYGRIDHQVEKLYGLIRSNCTQSFKHKERIRMRKIDRSPYSGTHSDQGNSAKFGEAATVCQRGL